MNLIDIIVPTITFGNILEIVVMAVGGLGVLFKMNMNVTALSKDVTTMQKEIAKIGDVLTKLAVADTRLNNIEADVRELRHGDGFVRGKMSRTSVDGLYP